MTVRAWFTISALVLAALAAAFIFRLFQPMRAPEMRLRAGDTTLEGSMDEACWIGRNGERSCEGGSNDGAKSASIPPRGEFRLIVLYPVQPETGEIRIDGPDGRGEAQKWRSELPYELEPGRYTLTARADYPERSFIRYVFRFTVTRSGD